MASIATIGYVNITDAESITGWSGDTFELEPDIKVEGSNSVACSLTSNGTNTITYDPAGSWDLSGKALRFYFNTTIVGNLNGTTAVQIGIGTQYITVFPTGADYGGGWTDVVIDAELFTTITLTTATSVALRLNTASKPRNVPQNTWVDNIRALNGLTLTSSTTEAYDFADAAALDKTSVYGVLNDTDGVVFCTGDIVVGDATSNSNLVSVNETLVFPDRNVDSALYKLEFNSGTGTTDIDISGMVCKTVNSAQAAELLLDASYDSLSITGSSFITMGTMTITSTATTPTFSGNSFTSCGASTIGLDIDGCTFTTCDTVTFNSGLTITGCDFIKSSATSSISIGDLGDLDACAFASDGTGHAIDLGTVAATTTMNWDCFLTSVSSEWTGSAGTTVGVSGTANDAILVSVSSGQTLTINVATGATIPTVRNTGTGTVTITAGQVTTTITVVDIDTGAAIENANVYLVTTAGGPLPADTVIIGTATLTNASGIVTDTRSLASNQPVTGRVRRASAGFGTLYKTSPIVGTINSASGLDVTVQMIKDE